MQPAHHPITAPTPPLQRWLRGLLSFFYPPRCLSCEQPTPYAPSPELAALLTEAFCTRCQKSLYPLQAPLCSRCGHPLDEASTHDNTSPTCEYCRKEPPKYDAARAAFGHVGAVRKALHKFKYGGDIAIGRALAELFAASVCHLPLPWHSYDLAAPVPLHPKRLRERGFQQAWCLLQKLPLPMPKKPFLLERYRYTNTQAGLDRASRLKNLRNAIQVSPDIAHTISGANVLLIDDVLTTGATANACATALRHAGAARIDILTLCRAML